MVLLNICTCFHTALFTKQVKKKYCVNYKYWPFHHTLHQADLSRWHLKIKQDRESEKSENDVNATWKIWSGDSWLTSQRRYQPAVTMVLTFTVAQGDQRFSVNVNLTPDISTAQCHREGVKGGSNQEKWMWCVHVCFSKMDEEHTKFITITPAKKHSAPLVSELLRSFIFLMSLWFWDTKESETDKQGERMKNNFSKCVSSL